MLLLLFLLIFGRRRIPAGFTLFLALLEIGLVNVFIALNGAASNPFSSILLVPLVLSLMLLPFKAGFVVLAVSMAGQSLQLIVPAAGHHSAMMQNHAQGMVLSFVLTSLLVTTVIFYFRLQLGTKTAAIQQLRERQLRDEQLLAIGTAAAQLTHDAATPVQTMRLILEELQESLDENLLIELEGQFYQLETLLKNWRDVADDVRESRTSLFEPATLITSIRHLLLLARPEAEVSWPPRLSVDGSVKGDRTLIPALANIVINACDAASGGAVTVSVGAEQSVYRLTVTNPINNDNPFPKELLGSRFIQSESGFGVGAVLSNATIEKCGGKVSWENHASRVTTVIALPLVNEDKTTDD
mgnify:FL=1